MEELIAISLAGAGADRDRTPMVFFSMPSRGAERDATWDDICRRSWHFLLELA